MATRKRARGPVIVDKDEATPIVSRYKSKSGNKPMVRRACRSRTVPFIAYDLETTRIAAGTPKLLYITAYGETFRSSEPIKGRDRFARLAEILTDRFLTPALNGYRFIAWNGNGFDVFFIARALLTSPDFLIRPYLTRSNSIRGMRVVGLNHLDGYEWEFLDGMAMTGLDSAKMKLEKFVGLFAPQYPKLSLDFSQEEFDYKNKDHVAYAERDSEALYHAMVKANAIIKELTGSGLQPTMGNLGIKYLQSQIPKGVMVWKPNDDLRAILHGPAKRGGFCWIASQYVGPVWKYDLNQAYAGAMRDAELPCGSCVATANYMPRRVGVYHVTISREKRTRIPFYFRDHATNVGKFTNGREVETWIMSNELEHLRADDWTVKVHGGYYWRESFNLKEMVDNLERLRFTDPGGPSGALGTMIKILGNSAYGKLLEVLGGVELVMSLEQPEGYTQTFTRGDEPVPFVFQKPPDDPFPRVYHQPQIGCVITAHVRIQLREAACKAPGAFIYGDTDCAAYSKPVDFLEINATRYGAWKQESAGTEHIFVGKKIYYSADGQHAKGLNVRALTKDDFVRWFDGVAPTQLQTQRKNFVKFISGQEMFGTQERRGTDVTQSKQARLQDGEFTPL